MFTYLKVKNFALIEDVEIEFKAGFTAFVGETGAGKSLLVDAINILSGARSSVSYVKKGTEYAEIQGAFFLEKEHTVFQILDHADIEIEVGEDILVSRRITKDGRTVCRIQGNIVSAQLLKQMMVKLVDIHGQHENNYLLEEKNHLFLVDVFAQNEPIVTKYRAVFDTYYGLHEKQKKLEKLQGELERLPEFQKQLTELEMARVEPDELVELQEQFTALKDFSANFDVLQQATQIIENNQLKDRLFELNRTLENSSDAKVQELSARINSLYYEFEDIDYVINGEVEGFANQKQMQAEIEARISTIFTLQKKYGDDLPAAQETIAQKITELQNIEYDMIQNTKALEAQYVLLVAEAEKLHTSRENASLDLAKKIMKELQDLYLSHVEFSVEFQKANLSANGFDKVVFYIKTNVGEESKPLAQIASGGELSRIMLAIKVVFTAQQTLSTIIFDEIDTGVSGKVAQAIAKKMQVFSQEQQVFAITHLPQVLAASTQQLNIWKYVEDDKTHVQVKYLSETEHIEEVAKMLSGTEVHQSGLEHAKELIALLK